MSTENGKRRAETPPETAGSPKAKKSTIINGGTHSSTEVDELKAVDNIQEEGENTLQGLSSYSKELARSRRTQNAAMYPLPGRFDDTNISLTLTRSGQLTDELLKACFKLLARTSSADYKASSRGWSPKEKKEEMRDPEMWYILVQRGHRKSKPVSPAQSVLGFLSFMITHDDPPLNHITVGYIYEVHLSDEFRGIGLGSFLIGQAERIVSELGLKKMMLTVFTRNKGARRLYERLGYTKDQCSPSDRSTRRGIVEADYAILSKKLRQIRPGQVVNMN
jgi:ribosomal protein S18 acetylase RimI-like enzyme